LEREARELGRPVGPVEREKGDVMFEITVMVRDLVRLPCCG
jgi:hypothetical protein